MSTSSEFSQLSWQRSSPNSPEKSGTGGRLSPYRKETPAAGGDLNLGVSVSHRPGNGTPKNLGDFSAAKPKSLDLFPQQAGFGHCLPNEADSSLCKSAMEEIQRAQMTIFYAGQVFVFNNFPADRAGEVMLLAGQKSTKKNPFPATPATRRSTFASNLVAGPPDSISSSSPASPRVSMFEEKKTTQDQTQPPPQPFPCGLPIARKASIQRFLEKRKDRLTAVAPYQSCPLSAPSKLAGGSPWLGLAVQPQH